MASGFFHSFFISSPCLRLFGPGAAVHSDQDGGRLDILSPSGPHHGAGELEYGLRQCQESPRWQAKHILYFQFDSTQCVFSRLWYFRLIPGSASCAFQPISGYTGSLRATCCLSTWPGFATPWSLSCLPPSSVTSFPHKPSVSSRHLSASVLLALRPDFSACLSVCLPVCLPVCLSQANTALPALPVFPALVLLRRQSPSSLLFPLIFYVCFLGFVFVFLCFFVFFFCRFWHSRAENHP